MLGMAENMDTAAARQRVITALEALLFYVNRPPTMPYDGKLFEALNQEVRAASERYRKLVSRAGTEKDPTKAA